jgi:branched-chain amino acid transport system ATP-binding protein
VSKRFGGLHAVSNLSMTAPPGEITGLIGPNGAGKTTVVNLITGVFKLSEGSVRLGDRDISLAPRHEVARAGVARTFQTIRLLPDATVVENILIGMYRHQRAPLVAQLLALPASRRETKRFREAAMALLARFGMARYAEHPAGGLSYGDQRRVEIMRALASQPRLLLLDEPVAGMNDIESGRLGEIFLDLAREGMGLLLIEHNIGFVTRLCARIYVLDSGRLIAEGAPREVVAAPAVISAYLGVDDDA